jgi:ureidoacrylate peracid hydrolase
MGKLLAHDTIEAGRTALVVVDMQNYFCAPGFPHEVPMAREIVPNINRLAEAVHGAGGPWCGSRRQLSARSSIGATTPRAC